MIKNVQISRRLREKGITENHRGYPSERHVRVFGADTETVLGVPYTFQIRSETDEIISRTTPRKIFVQMMRWLEERGESGGVNLVWFHNLNFDLRSVFHANLQAIYDQYNDIRIERDGWVIKLLFGRVNHATIWKDLGGYLCPKCPGPVPKRRIANEGGKLVCTCHRSSEPQVRRNLGIKFQFLDSAAFCPPGSKSLEGALKIYGINQTKLPKPRGLGEKKIWTPAFKEYALNDCRVERALGLKILDLHKQYDLTICVSLPQLAARILRHHFMRPGESFPFPPEGCRLASEVSYHAGKNGFYTKRGVYENVFEYDINSAFPKAMLELPQMVRGKYRVVDSFVPNRLGVYRISGRCRGVRIPAIFSHEFKPIKEGEFRRVWVTGFEIELLQGNKDYDFKIERGWIWEPKKGYEHSPLAEFVKNFWEKKSNTPKGSLRDTYKNILNSLYGKFAACVEKRGIVETAFGLSTVNDPTDGLRFFVAGALYHPFIATQITGYVRREIYRLEMKGAALHTATDSIKTFNRLITSDKLGGLKEEVYGRCYLFRTKLYLHFARDNKTCGHDLKRGWIRDRVTNGRALKVFDRGQHLCKWALHGFKGSVFDLFKKRHQLLKDGYLDYSFKHMVSLREGFKRQERVSTMTTRKERLSLNEPVF